MFCKNCGTQLQDHAAFCPKCGTKVMKAEPSLLQRIRTGIVVNEKLVIGAVVILVISVSIIGCLHIKPYIYKTETSDSEWKNYDKAAAAFSGIADYKNSEGALAKILFLYTKEYIKEVNNYEALGNDDAEEENYEYSSEVVVETKEKNGNELLEGFWKTEDGNMSITASVPRPNVAGGGDLEFVWKFERSTAAGMKFKTLKSGVRMNDLPPADRSYNEVFGDVITRGYNWGNWNYNDGILYLDAVGAEECECPCILDGDTMKLTIAGKTFTLTRK